MRILKKLGFLSAMALANNVQSQSETALDRYVNQADPAYQWQLLASDLSWDQSTYFLNMTSQQWRDATEVSRPVWQHELIVTLPKAPWVSTSSTAILLIDGGSNTSAAQNTSESAIATIANLLGMAIVVVKQVPNQPLFFSDEAQIERKEDQILAYSMDKFLTTGDETWPVHFAMTKAAVRAMDAAQAFLQSQESLAIDDFIVMGGSKRGWTAWLTAAVDSRVKAIMPVSADLLNIRQQFRHHWGSYGFYAPAIRDYRAFDLPCRMQDEDRGLALAQSIDPYFYRDRLTLPKYVINSTGDQFFVTDSSRHYYQDLQGSTFLRNTFNTDHFQGDTDQAAALLIESLLWIDDVNKNNALPDFTWSTNAEGLITLNPGSVKLPNEVKLWYAHNPYRRDFRLETIGSAWQSTVLNPSIDGHYYAQMPIPERGYVAYAVEMRFEKSSFATFFNAQQYYTTEVVIRPEGLEHEATFCMPRQPGEYRSRLPFMLHLLDLLN